MFSLHVIIRVIRLPIVSLAFLTATSSVIQGDDAKQSLYPKVDALFVDYCLDCHSHDEPDAGLNLESYASLLKGGQNGSPIIEGDSERSPLVRLLVGFDDPNGKKRIMPPGRRKKLTAEEINTVRAWIDQGALAPATGWRREITFDPPSIKPLVDRPSPIHSMASAPSKGLIALGKYRTIDLVDQETRVVVRSLTGHQGNVNSLDFNADQSVLYTAAGEPGLHGEIKKWDVETGALLATMTGHHDAIYALAVRPDGKQLASGSYDQTILLWDTEIGQPTRTLEGHQGAVFDLDYRVDGKILASASADRTVKLWDVESGNRQDTLSQPLKEQHAVRFNRDGTKLFAAGVDNRIRVWSISESARETTNSILDTRFAHEGTILRLTLADDGQTLASTADDQTIKIWNTNPLQERTLLPRQPDWSPAIAFFEKDTKIAVGRLNGSTEFYDVAKGEIVAPPKPEIVNALPRGLVAGDVTRVFLKGKHLHQIESIEFDNTAIQGAVGPDSHGNGNQAELLIFAPESLKPGSYAMRINTSTGESNKLSFHLDYLSQVQEDGTQASFNEISALPINIWGELGTKGEVDRFRFQAKAGDQLVFDAAANRIGSKANLVITLETAEGRALGSSQGFDNSPDPLLSHRFESDGTYQLAVADRFLNSSAEHYYRISVGSLPYVTDVSPRLLPKNSTSAVQLIGYNLDSQDTTQITTDTSTQPKLDLDPRRYRFRALPKLALTDYAANREQEPNDQPEKATPVAIGENISGRIMAAGASRTDQDYFRFSATKGQSLIIETIARELGSPIDTRLEVLRSDGTPIERLLLEAVRETAITFRPITSTAGGVRLENWEEMSLNDYLYMNGEVVKLFLAPRGPDSSWDFYPGSGSRRNYFDTSATAHANFEPCYIVRPHPPKTKLVPNGLPRFPLHYSNDDHSEAGKGSDSRIYFSAPENGDYLVRVVDTRNQNSPRYTYQLLIRERRPDFDIGLSDRTPSINRGSGRSFTVNRKRIDGYDGRIEIEFEGLPKGVTISSPIVIEEGHHQATGTLFVDEDVTQLSRAHCLGIQATATATVNGVESIRSFPAFKTITVADAPKLFVSLEPIARQSQSTEDEVADPSPASNTTEVESKEGIPVITISAGTTVNARIKVKRNGHKERITFSVSNLPHGVIVDNIGLNGVLMPPDVSEREIFLTAADWVEPVDRLCHAVANEAGRQTSRPVILRVVPSAHTVATR